MHVSGVNNSVLGELQRLALLLPESEHLPHSESSYKMKGWVIHINSLQFSKS